MTARYKIRREGGVIDTQTGEAILPTDARWHSEYQPWITQHNVPLAPDPLPAPPPPQHNFRASGRVREQRAIEKLAKTDPTAALLRKAGLK